MPGAYHWRGVAWYSAAARNSLFICRGGVARGIKAVRYRLAAALEHVLNVAILIWIGVSINQRGWRRGGVARHRGCRRGAAWRVGSGARRRLHGNGVLFLTFGIPAWLTGVATGLTGVVALA